MRRPSTFIRVLDGTGAALGRRLTLLLVATILLAACGGSGGSLVPASGSTATPTPTATPVATSTPAVTPEDQPWIAYEWYVRRNEKDVVLIHPDGTARHVVAGDIETDEYHAQVDWSPDGGTIVFVVGEWYEGTSIWTVGVDGSGATKVLGPSEDCPLGVNWPAFSPDGGRLLYGCVDGESGIDPDLFIELRTFDLVTGATTTVAVVHVPEELINPRWSRDGTMAVVELRQWDPSLETQLGSQIATVPITGGEFTRLTEPDLWAADPDWSPTQDLIVFGTYPLSVKDMSKPSTVYTIRPDGSGLTAITDGTVDGRSRITTPRWTPDGTRLLVSVAIGSGEEIRDVKIAFLELDGTMTMLGSVSGVASRLQPIP